MNQSKKTSATGFLGKIKAAGHYCAHGVWNSERNGKLHKIIRAGNLAVRCFFNHEVQERACSLTYRTVLAMVPALAMLFAIARGFGFQNIVQGQLLEYFPSQRQALEEALAFVDRYLAHANEGAFLGIGLLVLVYTVVMLMSNVERAFNKVWGVEKGRPFYRKFTDFTAIFIFIPILLACSAGVSIFLSSTVQEIMPVDISPVVHILLQCLPLILIWLVFSLALWLVPYTRVKFKYAFISGVVFGSLHYFTQWLFIQGQMCVSNYNAIYGSFAFLPLLLVWMQLSWTLLLMGVVMTYSLQSIYEFNYNHHSDVDKISPAYYDELTIMSLAVIVKRFENEQAALTMEELAAPDYNIPIVLVRRIINRLRQAGLVSVVVTDNDKEAYQPAFTIEQMTLLDVKQRIDAQGSSRFLSVADRQFAQGYGRMVNAPAETLVKDLL